jgi:hypothetical protein
MNDPKTVTNLPRDRRLSDHMRSSVIQKAPRQSVRDRIVVLALTTASVLLAVAASTGSCREDTPLMSVDHAREAE